MLGILLLPFAISRDLEAELRVAFDHRAVFPARTARGEPSACADCGCCIGACPTGALGPDGRGSGGPGYRRERCLQHWSALEEAPPADIQRAWTGRLYGCDACLEACPWFAPSADRATTGELGPGLPAGFFAAATDEEIRSRLRGSALGLSWMSPAAFRRSARLALGSAGPAFDEPATKS